MTTARVKNSLAGINLPGLKRSSNSETQLYDFAEIIRDWLSYLRYPQLDLSLSLVDRLVANVPEQFVCNRHWMYKISSAPNVVSTLLYRHYLLQNAVMHEPGFGLDFYPVFMLIASTLGSTPRFMSIETIHVLSHLLHRRPAIDDLRLSLHQIRHRAISLANRTDITVYQLDRDHAMVNTLSTIYALSIIREILLFHERCDPTDDLSVLIVELEKLYDNLRGVLLHVENE